MRMFTTKNEDALTDHSNSLFVLQYVELSSLVQDIPTRPMARKRLEHELCRRYGAGQATRWGCAEELIARGQAHDHDHDHDHANVTDLMADIAEKGRLLVRRGLDVLVIDTVGAVPKRKLPKFSADLKHLWQSGIEIVLCIEEQTVFFDDMKELVTTNEFIDIYVKSMCTSHMGREPHAVAKHNATPFRQSAGRAC